MIGEKEEIKLPVSLRDYFAGQALMGIVGIDEYTTENSARISYEYADAMLKERNK